MAASPFVDVCEDLKNLFVHAPSSMILRHVLKISSAVKWHRETSDQSSLKIWILLLPSITHSFRGHDGVWLKFVIEDSRNCKACKIRCFTISGKKFKKNMWNFSWLNQINLLQLLAYVDTSNQHNCNKKKAMLSLFTKVTPEFKAPEQLYY